MSALSLAGTAAYFSIFGLAKLFFAAGYGIIILASSLEFSKLVAVSYVYRYWNHISKILRSYYIFGILFIMLLTSMGVYSYLVSSYQKSANKIEIRDSQIKIAENKKTLFVNQLERLNKTIESNNNRINNLSNVRNLQERRLDTLYNRKQTSNARRTETSISGADDQIKFLNVDITDKMKQSSSINDSIAYYDQKIVEYKSSDVSNEIGPLKYLSELTTIPMNKVVNILILLIIFVFDPMAISLLIGVNQLTMMYKKEDENENEIEKDESVKEKKNLIEKIPETDIKEKSYPIEKQLVERIIYKDPIVNNNIDDVDDDVDDETKIIKIDGCPDGYDEEKVILNKSNVKNGLRIYHDIFGKGTILKFNNDKNRILIDFDNNGIKELNLDFANLKEILCIEKLSYLDFSNEEQNIVEDLIVDKPTIIEEELNLENIVPVVEEQKKKKIQKFFQKNLTNLTSLMKKK